MHKLDTLSDRYRDFHRGLPGQEFVWGGNERAEPLRRAVGGPDRRVLDIGCRYGALTREYMKGNEVVGLDVDRAALAEAAKLGIQTVWADAEEPLPFEDESFDVVVAAEVLEHLRDPAALVDETRRVLRPGGIFAGSVPNAYRLKNRLRFLAGRPAERNPTHLHLFTPGELLELLDGFAARLDYVVGRFVRFHPRLLANVIVFRGQTSL